MEIGKEAKIAEILVLQASQRFEIAKKLLLQLSSVFPVEVQGGLVHRKGTRNK